LHGIAPGGRLQISGAAKLRFQRRGAETALADLYHHDPLRILMPGRVDDTIPIAVLVNTAGGLVGGDRLETEIVLDDGCAALITTQAAEKVYRSAGRDVDITNHLRVGAGGWAEWLPHETILFDACRLRRRLTIDVGAGARVLAGETLVFGRIARGEQVRSGLVHDEWRVRLDGKLAWADALHLDGDIARTLAAPAGFDRARAAATLVYAGADAAERLDLIRDTIAPGGGVASCLGPLVVARWLSPTPHELRAAFGAAWATLRGAIGGLPGIVPRIWHV
jgi:urease accessory protein